MELSQRSITLLRHKKTRIPKKLTHNQTNPNKIKSHKYKTSHHTNVPA